MKKAIIFIIVVALVLTITPALIFAKMGPVEKATGAVWLDYNDVQNRYVEFNAHEPKEDEEYGKGSVTWYQWTGAQEWYEVTPSHQVVVKYVKVSNDTAWFAAGPGSQGWLVMKVKDGGSPATAGDEVSAVWVSTEGAAEAMVNAMGDLSGNVYIYNLIGGNLVVHTYE